LLGFLIKGRYITDGVALLQEVLREAKFRKQGVILKIDFEKAYDKVNWEFLFDYCRQKLWIKNVNANGTLSVKVNDKAGHILAVKKELDKEILLLLFFLTWQLTALLRWFLWHCKMILLCLWLIILFLKGLLCCSMLITQFY
jgi:hypothetical protein